MALINTTEAAVLTALTSGDLYGRALIERVKRVSDGQVKLNLGSVYPTLYRMEQKKLVKAYWGDEEEERNGPRRRYYQITGVGQRALDKLAELFRHREQPA
jgi:PadR family transcriptional regulator, regulatory protein PadR